MRVAERIDFAGFRAAQCGELVCMWRESFELGVGVKDFHPIEDQERFLLEELAPRHTIRVASVDGAIVGFIAATSSSVAQLHVRVGFHRRGIGSRLLEWAREQSNGSLWLYTFACNRVARAFYEHHGFRIVARGFEPTWQLEDLRYEWTGGR